MDLNLLQIFTAIAEHKSFTKAASQLKMDKSTVSSKLSHLEANLGVRLLHRSTRSVSLTEAGEGYLRYCQQIMETALEAQQFTANLGDEAVGLLRVSTTNYLAEHFIRTLIKPFIKENPKVEVELDLSYSSRDLIKDRFDVALRVGTGSLKDSNLVAKKILEAELGLFCSPAFVKEHGELKRVEEMANFDFIKYTNRSTFEVSQNGVIHEVVINSRFKINDILSTREAAVLGLGIAVMPKFIASEAVKNKQLVNLLADCQFPLITIYAVYHSRKWMPAKLKSFLDFLTVK
ncbi:LysR family transcriptional regulator [Reinekea sp.]|uniref:LysR family transcriptional regulator n=1 Tax=Reinekea sp. TaxID=1970455 RepID=UPI002A7FEFAC|nr:LysR family transcriptional regulator [Reinekea sp.]